MDLTFLAVQPPGRLSALAHRIEAIHPHTALINGWRSEATLFQRYEVEGPAGLWAGRIDLLFVVVVVMPMLILALSTDVLSQESSAGRLKLFLVQGGRADALLLSRAIAVGSIAIAVPMVAVVSVVAVSEVASAAVSVPLGLWLGGIAAYGLLWTGLAGLIAVRSATPFDGALAGLACWAALVVVLPSTAQFAAEAAHPTQSRVAHLTQARIAEADTHRNVAERAEMYIAQHHGGAGGTDTPDEGVPGYYRTSFLSHVDVNARTAPMVEQREAAQANQRALVSALQILALPLAVQLTLQEAAGAGPGRAAAFRRQAREHLDVVLAAIGTATVNQTRMTVAEAEAIPQFVFDEPKPPAPWPLLWVAAVGLGLFLASLRLGRRVT